MRQQQRGETPRTVQPVTGVTANEPRAKPGIAFEAVVRLAAAKRTALQTPEDFVDAQIKRPHRAAAPALAEGLIDVRNSQSGAALKAVVDQQVGVEVCHHR